MKLVVFDKDWADEFSPFGFAVMNPAEFEEFNNHYSTPQDWYFGTNEGYEDEVLINGCTITEISQDEADILARVFNLKKYAWGYLEAGLFPAKPEEIEEDQGV